METLFFDRKIIDDWLLQNSYKSQSEIQDEALEFALNKKRA